MKVLLDECLPRKLKMLFVDHEVTTVPEARWAGVKDTALLRLAETRFDVFVTADQNLQYQQSIGSTTLGIVILVAKNTMLETLRPLVPGVLEALEDIAPGDLLRVENT